MYTVECLQPQDFQWAVHTAARRMMCEEVKRPDLYDAEQFEKLTNIMLSQETALIVKKNGTPIGVLGAILNPSIYNPKVMVLAEILWYVLPDYRGGRAGYLLIQEYRKLADSFGCEATLCTLATSEVNQESLERFGFKFGEKSYLYKQG